MSRRAFAVSAAVAPLIAAGAARAADGGDWVRSETPGFVLCGNVGEKTLRDFADSLMRRDRFEEAAAILDPVFNNPHAGPEGLQARARFEQAKARGRPVEAAGADDKAASAN